MLNLNATIFYYEVLQLNFLKESSAIKKPRYPHQATEWNPSKSGAANGIIGFFIGLSGFIGSFTCALFVNPNNIGMEKVYDPSYPSLGDLTAFYFLFHNSAIIYKSHQFFDSS